MQWHPIFAHLLRPLVESHFEIRLNQPVGDIPRTSDIVLLHKTSAGPVPFKGLWRRLTTWNVLEYKGPTESARFDQLHDLLELGLGIHRRLNEQQRKAKEAEVGYPEVSLWYLVNHIGHRFLAELPAYLPRMEQQAEGIWQAAVYRHPVFLVSVQELAVERDSLPLHVLAGVSDEQGQRMITDVLKAEPALWPNYGGWIMGNYPAIWQEITLMTAHQDQGFHYNPGPLAEALRETGGLKDFIERAGIKASVEAVGIKAVIEAVGIKPVIEAIGPQRVLAALGVDEIVAGLSPEQREQLRQRLNQQGDRDNTSAPT
jgi:hypothetical protein